MNATKSASSTDLAGIRDTVESMWVAIVLAFVLRAFMVEGFAIPTGSMAPRLMGEHWQLQCPACGYEYAYGFQQESPGQEQVNRAALHTPTGAVCPNCSRPYRGQDAPDRHIDGGDRVLVLKYPYHFGDPQPWDVVVFRNPQNNRENFIKRLVGVPGETLEIVHGDLFVAPGPQGPWGIRRKPDRAQQAIWQVVYDNDYMPRQEWLATSDAPRWTPDQPQLWTSGSFGREYDYNGHETQALRFEAPGYKFLPHYGYNPQQFQDRGIDPQMDFCTDLKLLTTFAPQDPASRVILHLSSFEHRFRGELGASGQVRLLYQHSGSANNEWVVLAQGQIKPVAIGESVEVALENVDLGVRLRVNERQVLEVVDSYPMDYTSLKRRLARGAVPVPEVMVLADGGPCRLAHLRLYRDVYYTCTDVDRVPRGPLGVFARSLGVGEPAGWGTTGHPITLAKFPDRPDLDQFWVLGDNSPLSADGRAWTSAAPSLRLSEDGQMVYQLGTVPRYNLIGRAFLVYWPAGFRPPGLANLPLVPNVGKMRLIR